MKSDWGGASAPPFFCIRRYQWEMASYDGFMRSTVTVDRAGRVVLPKTLRDELHLLPGDTLDIALKGNEMTLRPRRAATPLAKERGVWVLRTGEPLTTRETSETLGNLRGSGGA